MGIDYTAHFGIGVEVEINEDKLPDLSDFDDLEEYLCFMLESTNFYATSYGDSYSEDLVYCIVLKPLDAYDIDLKSYKAELDKWLSLQEAVIPTSKFGLVGGAYVY